MSRGILCGGCALIVLALAFAACTTGVEPSPHAGYIRVVLESNEQDTMIVILGDTTRFSRYDAFFVHVFDGRIYRGDNYAPIYVNTSIQRVQSDTVNILAREWLSGIPITIRDSVTITPANSRYRKFTIFEWAVPPGTYDMLQFGLLAEEVATYIPKLYVNPVQLPPGVSSTLYFPVSFSIQEDKVTQIDVEISPFKSLHRYQDSFLFDRQVRVAGIQTF